MTTTESTPPATTDNGVVDWDDIFAAATTEDVKHPAPKPTWDGPIPEGLRRLAVKANDTGERVIIPLKGENAQKIFDQTRAMVFQIASEFPPKDGSERTANVRAQHSPKPEEKLIAITFTITNKRGRKTKPAPTETAPAETAPAAATGDAVPTPAVTSNVPAPESDSTNVTTTTTASDNVTASTNAAPADARTTAERIAAKTTPRRGGK